MNDEDDDECTVALVKVLAGAGLEEEVAGGELEDDAGHGPHVDGCGVLGAHDGLQRPILPRLDVIGKVLVGPARVAKVHDLHRVVGRLEAQAAAGRVRALLLRLRLLLLGLFFRHLCHHRLCCRLLALAGGVRWRLDRQLRRHRHYRRRRSHDRRRLDGLGRWRGLVVLEPELPLAPLVLGELGAAAAAAAGRRVV
jgi:hypothetical protein